MHDHSKMIREALWVRSMTAMELANQAGITRGQMSMIISFKRTLTMKQAIAISGVLKVVKARELLIAQLDRELGKKTTC